jgi:levanase/fructan beta-fructosidase
MYTAAGDTSPESKGVPFTQCIAYSNDKGRTFTKYEHNPVLPHIVGGNRDPKLVWFEPTKQWTLALYLDGDEYGLFTSPDLKQWKQTQTIKMPGSSECPDFFPIKVEGEKARKWVLTGANGHYLVGDYDGAQFKPEGPPQAADTGANYYAVQTYSDIPAKDGRRIQIAWMNGGKYPEMPFNQQMSFPCELTLHRFPEGLRLCRMPVKEISQLYSSTLKEASFSLQPDHPLQGHNKYNSPVDLYVAFNPGQSTAVGFKIQGETIRYNSREQTITCCGRTTALPAINGTVKLRILVDRTSIELFGNDGRVSMTSCFVPAPGNLEITLFAEGAAVNARSLVAHELNSAWTDL